MRKGVLIAGIVVLVLGGLIAAYAFVDSTQSTTIPSPSTGLGLDFTPSLIGSGTVKLSWSDASSQFRFSVYQCATSACSSPSGAALAEGSGASGSVSFTASGGQWYAVDASAGSSQAVPVSVDVSGLTILLLIGIVILAVGALIALLGVRMKAKVKLVEAPEEEPVKEMFVTTPFSGVQDASAAAPEAAAPAYRPEAAEPSGPVYFEPTTSASTASGGGPTGGAPAARGPIVCPSCGTMNDFWLTNCRNCRRPLTVTGQ